MPYSGLVLIKLFYYGKIETYTKLETRIINKSDDYDPASTISNTWPILYAQPGSIS